MIERPVDRRVPLPPPLAMRVAVLGGLAFLLFAVMLFRLWYLQVLSGPQYVQLANNNRIRDVPIAAPRGELLDRNGDPLVQNVVSTAIQIDPTQLPSDPAAQTMFYEHLAPILGMHAADIRKLVDSPLNYHFAPVTIQTQASQQAVVYLSEHAADFPAVSVQSIYIRSYPYGALAAQVLGNIGQINTDELAQQHYSGAQPGTIVGQSGLEWQYDRYLRGTPGADKIQVNASGQPTRQLGKSLPIAGHDLRLSLDLGLQREGEKALLTGMSLAQGNGNPADAGAFVALDPNSGQVLAMGSYPTYDPSIFTKPIPQPEYNQIFGSLSGGAPGAQFNRAIAGQYPTGSTFKPITALAALNAGVITPYTSQGGGQCVTVSTEHFCNSGKANYGDLDLTDALQVSEDTFFYEVGEEANSYGDVIQSEARELGFGAPTGIDLPGEQGGVVPDRTWVNQNNAQYDQLCREGRYPKPAGSSTCDYEQISPWTIGQNMQLAVGQGYFLATPLQMAVAYSALVNGGTVWQPRLAMEIDDAYGRLIQTLPAHAARHVSIDPAYQQTIMQGLHLAASAPSGTSADVFTGWPQDRYPVYGKTGTAQHGDLASTDDQSWYVCYVPDGKHSIVVAVTIEHGGFGAQAAAPAARLMLSEWFGLPLKVVAGTSTTL